MGREGIGDTAGLRAMISDTQISSRGHSSISAQDPFPVWFHMSALIRPRADLRQFFRPFFAHLDKGVAENEEASRNSRPRRQKVDRAGERQRKGRPDQAGQTRRDPVHLGFHSLSHTGLLPTIIALN